MSDWLDTTPSTEVLALPIPADLPADPAQRLALAEQCWAALTPAQRKFLTVFRNAGCNAHRAEREGGGPRRTHAKWRSENLQYDTLVKLFLGYSASKALDKERLLARQDDIVETLLTPKPKLYDGMPIRIDGVVLEEVEAGAASRANEVLLKAAGVLKDKEVEVNVGVVMGGPPTLNIEVLPAPAALIKAEAPHVVVDAQYTEVPDDDGWLET